MATIDMQTMRYINLLDKASHVKTHTCFSYNNTIMFAVPKSMISKALGPDAINVRRIQEELGKRVRIVPAPEGISDLKEFISKIIAPVGFKSIEIKGEECILNAGSQHKAALIGRNRRRYEELAIVIKDLFSLELKII
jgi:transcription antitermination factor NusA-like protein